MRQQVSGTRHLDKQTDQFSVWSDLSRNINLKEEQENLLSAAQITLISGIKVLNLVRC